ncbi:preprotein translocase subunit Sec61beta [archaeon]|jgi:preprotein translocase subunit Sec61beta|nr:preprotein translocase subunit Sec61beta [archaeon]MBT3438993.1 preprotein translocase subunit Sec61beta [Candidatus Woesearchaeota archaeon]MBT4208324.1 preprotein translocase subunit Sec61beta [Candidatus Woesearchaeota archaeon]MBT4730835.1 preprotein translocase subunit Sec61beta [Candidatus Woesearchaeota archaeon]MBT4783281.1 preprotein translocase subunit Sec61beta [Candidatus Woesearchaeota archaeon]
MAEQKMQMPSSGGGLVRYYDEYKTKIEISPKTVVGMIIVVILVEILLHTMG